MLDQTASTCPGAVRFALAHDERAMLLRAEHVEGSGVGAHPDKPQHQRPLRPVATRSALDLLGEQKTQIAVLSL
ncbi:hypothetical protein EVAR_30946_1 [Eumeta japonica]|uniref:Uncharacterized protein n=1 Tax=Eumeta variegata TaxID=151549 RepID=A0A4C1V4R1_EUMVA|nr:hypothetical protein EVAR_30946_1 [Eumeta japonica]